MLRIGWGEAEVSETIGAADRRGRRVVEGRVVGSAAVRVVAVDGGGDALRMPCRPVHDDDLTAAPALEILPEE
jgi:hypothetical protein